jgi:pilus assembly protein CpaC
MKPGKPLYRLAAVAGLLMPLAASAAQAPAAPARVAQAAAPGPAAPASATPGTAVQDAGEIVVMYIGEVRTLPITAIQRVAVGNGKVISTTVLDREMLVLAENQGETGMQIWFKDGTVRRYTVRVTLADLGHTQLQLSRILDGVPGVKVERMGEFVVITGATSRINLQRIAAVAGQFKQVLNMAREEEVTMKKMVYLRVQIIEFKRAALESIGIKWGTQLTGPTFGFAWDVITSGGFTARQSDPGLAASVPGTVGPGGAPGGAPPLLPSLPPRVSPPLGYLGIATSILSQINLAVQQGDAYVLATPELSTRSGGEAKFLAGGQIPIVTPASGLNPATVQYKDYGIQMSINPVADEKNNIMAVIKTELSTIDPATGTATQPGFLTRKTDSEINVRDGETIVLSGLVNTDLATQVDKVPWLGDLPILGALFRSTNFRNNRSDLVIFVTPMVVDPQSTLTRERIQKGREIREKFDGFLQKKGIVD